eukprot:1628897-Amphidinium_carterae.2
MIPCMGVSSGTEALNGQLASHFANFMSNTDIPLMPYLGNGTTSPTFTSKIHQEQLPIAKPSRSVDVILIANYYLRMNTIVGTAHLHCEAVFQQRDVVLCVTHRGFSRGSSSKSSQGLRLRS